MNKKRIFVIFAICVLFIICYSIINIKYDRLARYPFGTDKEREIIERELDDQEIDYIVEYAIEPDFFMKYIHCYRFNIYHVDLYNHFCSLFPQFSIGDSVTIVERLSLLNKANDNYYNELLKHDTDYITKLLKTYSCERTTKFPV